jgi:chemotaxis protein CheX
MSTNVVSNTDLVRLTQQLWSEMLSLDLIPVSAAAPKIASGLVAFVQVAGGWDGTVRLDISSILAREAAAALLGVPAEEVSRDQVGDTAGELANITGGSVKALLPAPSKLSLPVVAEAADYTVESGDDRRLLQAVFRYRGENLVVTILGGEL